MPQGTALVGSAGLSCCTTFLIACRTPCTQVAILASDPPSPHELRMRIETRLLYRALPFLRGSFSFSLAQHSPAS